MFHLAQGLFISLYNSHSVQKVGCPGTWQTGRRISLIASTGYVTILFGMEGIGSGTDGRDFWDLHYDQIV